MVLDPLTITFAITLVALVLFVTEWISPAFTALFIAATLMLLGVVSPAEGLAGPGTETTITVLCMFILAGGIEHTGLLNELARRVLHLAGGRPAVSFLILMLLAGGLSSVLNNTPVIVLMIPLIITIANRMERSASLYLMPVAFAAMLGGTLTLVGTSTNLVGSDIARRLGFEGLRMFTLLPVAAIVFVVGTTFLFVFGPKLAPARRETGERSQRYGLDVYLAEIEIPEASSLVGKTLERSDLRYGFDIEVLRIYRGGQPIVTDAVRASLRAGDVLLVHASPSELVKLLEATSLIVRGQEEREHHLEEEGLSAFEVTVAQGPHVQGLTLAQARFRQRFGAQVLGIKRGARVFRDQLTDVRLQPGDTLLLLGDDDARYALLRSHEFVLNEDLHVEPFRRSKQWLAVSIFLAVILAAGLGLTPLAVAALTGVLAMGLTGCIRPHEIFEAVNWQVILVLVGLVPLGVAFVSTGASGVIADVLVTQAEGLAPLAVLAIVYAATFALAQVVTNQAAVVLMVPVGVEVARALSLDPFTFILACVFAGSAGFLTPIGHQASLMVYGPGEYRFTDFARLGIPLALIVGTLTVLLLGVFFPLTP